MNNEKIARCGLLLGCATMGLLSCTALTELIHKFRIHSLERKIYKQTIKFNNEIIDCVKKNGIKHFIKKGK